MTQYSQQVVLDQLKKVLIDALGPEAQNIDVNDFLTRMDQSRHLMDGNHRLMDILGISKEKMDVLYAIAYNLYKNRKFEKAQNIFSVLCICDPLNVDYWTGQANTLKNQQAYDLAIPGYHTLIKLRPSNLTYYLDLAECFLHLQQKEGAKNCLEALLLIADNPDLRKETPNAQVIIERAKDLLKNIKL